MPSVNWAGGCVHEGWVARHGSQEIAFAALRWGQPPRRPLALLGPPLDFVAPLAADPLRIDFPAAFRTRAGLEFITKSVRGRIPMSDILRSNPLITLSPPVKSSQRLPAGDKGVRRVPSARIRPLSLGLAGSRWGRGRSNRPNVVIPTVPLIRKAKATRRSDFATRVSR